MNNPLHSSAKQPESELEKKQFLLESIFASKKTKTTTNDKESLGRAANSHLNSGKLTIFKSTEQQQIYRNTNSEGKQRM